MSPGGRLCRRSLSPREMDQGAQSQLGQGERPAPELGHLSLAKVASHPLPQSRQVLALDDRRRERSRSRGQSEKPKQRRGFGLVRVQTEERSPHRRRALGTRVELNLGTRRGGGLRGARELTREGEKPGPTQEPEDRPATETCSSGHATSSFRRSASRNASARIVSVGFAVPPVGNTELPATWRFSMPCILQSPSTTPRFGSACMRVVPM